MQKSRHLWASLSVLILILAGLLVPTAGRAQDGSVAENLRRTVTITAVNQEKLNKQQQKTDDTLKTHEQSVRNAQMLSWGALGACGCLALLCFIVNIRMALSIASLRSERASVVTSPPLRQPIIDVNEVALDVQRRVEAQIKQQLAAQSRELLAIVEKKSPPANQQEDKLSAEKIRQLEKQIQSVRDVAQDLKQLEWQMQTVLDEGDRQQHLIETLQEQLQARLKKADQALDENTVRQVIMDTIFERLKTAEFRDQLAPRLAELLASKQALQPAISPQAAGDGREEATVPSTHDVKDVNKPDRKTERPAETSKPVSLRLSAFDTVTEAIHQLEARKDLSAGLILCLKDLKLLLSQREQMTTLLIPAKPAERQSYLKQNWKEFYRLFNATSDMVNERWGTEEPVTETLRTAFAAVWNMTSKQVEQFGLKAIPAEIGRDKFEGASGKWIVKAWEKTPDPSKDFIIKEIVEPGIQLGDGQDTYILYEARVIVWHFDPSSPSVAATGKIVNTDRPIVHIRADHADQILPELEVPFARLDEEFSAVDSPREELQVIQDWEPEESTEIDAPARSPLSTVDVVMEAIQQLEERKDLSAGLITCLEDLKLLQRQRNEIVLLLFPGRQSERQSYLKQNWSEFYRLFNERPETVSGRWGAEEPVSEALHTAFSKLWNMTRQQLEQLELMVIPIEAGHDKFDPVSVQWRVVRWEATEDPEKAGVIKTVVEPGLQLGDGMEPGSILREAHVAVWHYTG